jgi:hypothetical protein
MSVSFLGSNLLADQTIFVEFKNALARLVSVVLVVSTPRVYLD